MGGKYNHSVIYFLVLIVAFSTAGTGQEQPSTPYSYENQLDINNASYEEIALLPVPREIAERIYERIQYQGPFSSFFELRDIEGITQEILLKLKPLVRI
jgi:DNA uptake protein ComE-like DNA-binding protein